MSFRTLAAAAVLAAALAAPAMAQNRSDTGSMQYPQPNAAGTINGTVVPGARPDTGSMATPSPGQGGVGAATTPSLGNGTGANTGSMQYPQPLPQGNVGTTTTK